MPRTRRPYTPAFKAEAVKLVTEQGYAVAEAARSLGLNENRIRSWKQAFQAQGDPAFPGPGKLSPFEEVNRRRRAENQRFRAERDILKKAAFFAKEALGPSASSRSTARSGPCGSLRNAGGFPRRLLRLAGPSPQRPGTTPRYPPRGDADGSRRGPGPLRSPRIHAERRARGRPGWVNTVARLMRDNGIAAQTARKFRCTTDAHHDLPVAENLLDRPLGPASPKESWVADIPYLQTRAGRLYLAVVADRYSRRVVGWSMADPLESRLVADALALAGARRLPGAGLLAHSDRGRPYASAPYQRLLARQGITCSRSRRAACWDNAPMESFFASLKKELVQDADFGTRAEARAAIVEYLEVFSNTKRRHSALGYVSPAAYERTE